MDGEELEVAGGGPGQGNDGASDFAQRFREKYTQRFGTAGEKYCGDSKFWGGSGNEVAQASGPASSGTVAGGPESVQIVAQSQGGSFALERLGPAGPDGSVGAPSQAEASGLAWVAFGSALAPGKASGPASAPSKAESSGFEGAAGATHAAEDSVHGKGDSVQEAASTATGSGCSWLLEKGESSKLKAADYEPPPTKRRKVPPSFKIASMFGGCKER